MEKLALDPEPFTKFRMCTTVWYTHGGLESLLMFIDVYPTNPKKPDCCKQVLRF